MGILESKRKRSGRGVKEKEVGFDGCSGLKSGNATYMKSDQNKGDAIASVVTDEPVVKEKQDTSVDTGSPNVENTGLKSYSPLPMQGSTSAGNTLVVPVDSIKAVSERFANTAYGFFLGKWVAYPVIANYVRNTWRKYGLVKSMLNSSTGLFSFQFSSMDGLNAMLENGPWFICNHPLNLKMWNPDVNLLKKDVRNVLVCVKILGVPVMTFSQDGLSAIAMKIGTPLMLDSYTFDMCLQSWDRSSYVRAIIELKADAKLRDTIVVAMPKLTGEGFYMCSVRVKYEWKPHSLLKTSGNKKHDVKPTKEVSNSNLFDVLNSVENDVDLGTNGGTLNLVSKESNTSGSSFWNVENSSMSTTPIVEKIRIIEKLIMDGKATLVDNEEVPVKKVDYLNDYDSKDEVLSVDNDMARSMALEKGVFGSSLPRSLHWFVLRAYQLSMDRGFLSPKEKGSRRGVKEKEWLFWFETTSGLKSYPPLPTQGSTPAGNTLGMSSYANVTSVSSRKALNIHTLYTPTENEVDVVMPVESIKAVSERSSYVGAMIELKADAELRDTIVDECLKNPGLGVAKNMKKPSQAPKGFSVGSKVGFKPAKKYRPVPKKPTANTSGNKKHDVEHMKQNVESSSMSATPIVKKIRNLETLIIDEKATLMDDEGVPVRKVDYLSDYDSKDEVASVDNDIARSMAVEKGGFDDIPPWTWHQMLVMPARRRCCIVVTTQSTEYCSDVWHLNTVAALQMQRQLQWFEACGGNGGHGAKMDMDGRH
nr:hypothetical protein [Tanacetum cinerariifolium]